MMIHTILSDLASGQPNFAGVLAYIDERYNHIPTAFTNGEQSNSESENQGSARVLYFAKLHNLDKENTLRLFAEHYLHVLDTPGDSNHQNIRQFMQHGWEGISFAGMVLEPK